MSGEPKTNPSIVSDELPWPKRFEIEEMCQLDHHIGG